MRWPTLRQSKEISQWKNTTPPPGVEGRVVAAILADPGLIAAGFVGNSDAGDGMSPLHGFIPPAPKQAEQIFGVGLHLLLGLALAARDQTGDEPSRPSHLDHHRQRAILVKGGEGSTHIVCMG